ncbi:hypothetical protein FNH05_02275 [Amycolatopsis rhizosphaerae]|uniref:Uncharacterized protein n=1 Tax=Amycolatopsis rhizosphaerae TaxID=2053003 RepID=A0A558DL85_9PSEU|nr:hypothetical protein [Amycolatopsis rhizosphaerae]TVT61751.1 hypothetical protein FNH05_02275 [Amycolatopsis rhizosphaerae]
MGVNIPADGGGQLGSTGFIADIVAAVQTGVSEQALEQAKQSAQGLKNAASSGQLRITENGFDALMAAINTAYTELAQLRLNLVNLTQAPMLGTGPYAQQVSTHVQQGATGHSQSAEMVLVQFGEVLDLTREALNQAKRNYEDNEHGNVRFLKS